MANDRDDFQPEIRNIAWWASDTRRAVNQWKEKQRNREAYSRVEVNHGK